MAALKVTTLLMLTSLVMIFSSGVSTEWLSSFIPETLKIGAFNIQVLGQTKFGKDHVVAHLVKVSHIPGSREHTARVLVGVWH